jgi:hypothetical protein
MHLAYVSDSGDPRSFAVAILLIPWSEWNTVRDRLIQFRRRLRDRHGLLLDAELRASELLSRSGPWHPLSVRPIVRTALLRTALQELRFAAEHADVRVFAVVVPDRRHPHLRVTVKDTKLEMEGAVEAAWGVALERLERFSEQPRDTGVYLHISNRTPLSVRKMARRARRYAMVPSAYSEGWLERPFRRLVEDPCIKDPVQSYLMQFAGLAAFAALRTVAPTGTAPATSG